MMIHPNDWKPQVGDRVVARGVVVQLDADDLPICVRFDGTEEWEDVDAFRPGILRPDTSAPAEMDDVEVLRWAAAVARKHGYPGNAQCNEELIVAIEATRRPPTPLEALKAVVAELHGDAPWLVNARRAIAAEEAKRVM